jgi:hypothetical protein
MPTPADLASRHPRPLTARPVGAPVSARLAPAQAVAAPFRARFEAGIRRSTLHRNARLLALTLASYADWETGVIPDLDHPSLNRLSYATALSASNIRVSLHCLVDNGWIVRTPVPDDEVPSRVQLLIPSSHARARE